MTGRQRTLKVNIVGDIADLKNKLDSVERSTRSSSQKLASAGRLIQTGFAAVAGSAILKVGADLNRLGVQGDAIRNRFGVVFGDMSTDMREWADDVNERFGESIETVQGMANEIGDLLVPIGFTRQEAAELTKEVLQTSNALSEWTGGQITAADAAERVRKALLGERDGLEALGVKVLQSDVNARLAAQGQANLAGEERARAEALATLNIITDKSTDALDAYEDQANESLIAQKKLNAAIEEGRQALGDFVEGEVSSFNDDFAVLGIWLQDASEFLREYNQSTDDAASSSRSFLEELIAINPLGRRAIEWKEEIHQATLEEAAAQERANQAMRNARDAAGGFNPALAETVATATDAANAVSALRTQLMLTQQEQRAMVDPVFALRNANDRLTEAFERRVALQRDGANQSAINDAIQSEIEAAQDLEFARENLNEQGIDGLDLLDQYAEKYAIGADAIANYKNEVLGLQDALNGLPSSITIPTVTGTSDGVRDIEEELDRRGRAVIE